MKVTFGFQPLNIAMVIDTMEQFIFSDNYEAKQDMPQIVCHIWDIFLSSLYANIYFLKVMRKKM